MRNLIFGLAFVGVPQVSRLIRGTVLSLREMPFIEAGRVIGASDLRIMFVDILPNLLGWDIRGWAAVRINRRHEQAILHRRRQSAALRITLTWIG